MLKIEIRVRTFDENVIEFVGKLLEQELPEELKPSEQALKNLIGVGCTIDEMIHLKTEFPEVAAKVHEEIATDGPIETVVYLKFAMDNITRVMNSGSIGMDNPTKRVLEKFGMTNNKGKE